MKPQVCALIFSALMLSARSGLAQLAGVPAVKGDQSQLLLSDGRGVIIGVVDSGVDSLNPVLAGNDPFGNPRLVAKQNFVTYEPTNTGQDVFGHGTWISSIMLSSDPTHPGMAPGARYVNARVLDSNNSFASGIQVENGVGFAIDQGAKVINLSLNYFANNDTGNDPIELMLDWASSTLGVNFTNASGNISSGNGSPFVRGPATAYDGVTVGRTTATFDQVHSDSAIAPTSTGRDKLDAVAPGSSLILASNKYETQGLIWDPQPRNGTSFAAPTVAGLMAQEISYGQTNGLSVNPLVIKATILNSTDQVADKDESAWHPLASSTVGGVFTATSPVDSNQGTGQIDAVQAALQYRAKQQVPGNVGAIGWDLNNVSATAPVTYNIGQRLAGDTLQVTLDWFRHVSRIDNGDNIVNYLDSFTQSPLSNLDLKVLIDGSLAAQSVSTVDNVEYLDFILPKNGAVSIEVDGVNFPAAQFQSEQYGLAWNLVPEPSALLLAACCTVLIALGCMISKRASTSVFRGPSR
jgi:hypothetical protein